MSLRLARDAFLEGYRIASAGQAAHDAAALYEALGALAPIRAPFAFEGAAMAWTVREKREGSVRLECLTAAADARWQPFLALGMGCGFAKLGCGVPEEPFAQDGYGFLQGLVRRVWGLREQDTTAHIERGRGRALWFRTEGDADACAGHIGSGSFVGERWRGVATACVFAGDPNWHAARLSAAGGLEAALAAGADEALRLWQTLDGAPPRAVEAARVLAGRPPSG